MWHRVRLGAIVLTGFSLLSGCARERLDSTGALVYRARPAVVRVSTMATGRFIVSAPDLRAVAKGLEDRHLDSGNQHWTRLQFATASGGSGTGFIVRGDGFIVTSAHVVSSTTDRRSVERELRRNGALAALVASFPRETARVTTSRSDLVPLLEELAASGRLDDVKLVNRVILSNGESLPFVVRASSAALGQGGSDCAILKIERKDLPTLELGDSDDVRLQQDVWAVGYPAVASSSDEVIGGWLARSSDLEATVSPGTITAIKKTVSNLPIFQSNVAIYAGNSGGPVVDRDGRVIAIASWGHTTAEQIKFLVPINMVRPLLQPLQRTTGDSRFDESYRVALSAAASGDWSMAHDQLAEAQKYFPHSTDLDRMSVEIDRSIRRASYWTLHPRLALLLATLLVALLTAALVVHRVQRRKGEVLVRPDSRNSQPLHVDGEGRERLIIGRLTVLNGDHAGDRFGLAGSGIRIGREAELCEIVLDNPKVSRLHAEVVSIDGRVLLIDRNSSNGTYVNDQKIDKRFLSDGDIIYFGGRNAIAVAFHG